MNSRRQHRSFCCFIWLVVTCFLLSLALSQQFDSLTQRVTFYPAWLMVSHSPKPLTFYDNIKILSIRTFLTWVCVLLCRITRALFLRKKFFDELLDTVCHFQKVTRRLLSLPGFSTLIECNTYLPRYFQYLSGQPSKMSCPRAYRSSISECKTSALRFCRGFSVDERHWRQAKDRSRRSNWMCHAGVFGLFKAIYDGTGHKCEPNHVTGITWLIKGNSLRGYPCNAYFPAFCSYH